MPEPLFESGCWWICDVCNKEEGSLEALPEGWEILYRSGETMVVACDECVKERNLKGIE